MFCKMVDRCVYCKNTLRIQRMWRAEQLVKRVRVSVAHYSTMAGRGRDGEKCNRQAGVVANFTLPRLHSMNPRWFASFVDATARGGMISELRVSGLIQANRPRLFQHDIATTTAQTYETISQVTSGASLQAGRRSKAVPAQQGTQRPAFQNSAAFDISPRSQYCLSSNNLGTVLYSPNDLQRTWRNSSDCAVANRTPQTVCKQCNENVPTSETSMLRKAFPTINNSPVQVTFGRNLGHVHVKNRGSHERIPAHAEDLQLAGNKAIYRTCP